MSASRKEGLSARGVAMDIDWTVSVVFMPVLFVLFGFVRIVFSAKRTRAFSRRSSKDTARALYGQSLRPRPAAQPAALPGISGEGRVLVTIRTAAPAVIALTRHRCKPFNIIGLYHTTAQPSKADSFPCAFYATFLREESLSGTVAAIDRTDTETTV